MSSKKPRVLVAMSGGVDSSVAAALLVEQGYEVIGATMQVWDYSQCEVVEGAGTCCSSSDVDDARAVADRLGIPFYVLNCEEEFREKVIDPFIANYQQGLTPLPCVNCNTFLKFDHLVKKMEALGCDYLATGHYAQVEKNALGLPQIFTSTDDWKDQTYFLFTLEPTLLSRLLFPIGNMKKDQVREIAERLDLVVARKKDSTGICFVGNQGYGQFLENEKPELKSAEYRGPIRRYPSGEKMGEHRGLHHYTIGQGRGLGMDHHEKLFVVKIEVPTKTLWVGDEQYLYSQNCELRDVKWLDPNLANGKKLKVKIRYAHKGAEAEVREVGANHWQLHFQEPQRAITPGQAAVFYDDNQLVGGGWIR